MSAYLRAMIIGAIVYVAGRVVLWLLLPWFTYARAFTAIAFVFFLAGALLLLTGLKAHVVRNRSRRLWEGCFLIGVGFCWLFINSWLLLR
jgi:hypothetical protein